MKKILVILDGASDLPVEIFGGKTPFEAAKTENLDFFTSEGRIGYMYPINEKIVPGSDNSLLNLFGNDYKKYGRGTLEAIGLGFNLSKGDLAIRTNFGTIKNMKNKEVIDRRAGRTLTSKESEILGKSLNEGIHLPAPFEFKSGIQHRGVVVFRGGFSENISNIDNEWSGKNSNKFKFSEPLDDDENTKYTANIVNDFVDQAFGILNNHPVNKERIKKGLLPANMLFMRGAGASIPDTKEYASWMSINSMPLEIGIAEISGMKNFSFKYPELNSIDVYENLHLSLSKSIKFAISTLKRNHKNFIGCYIQFKETDLPGHDNKPYEKKNMIELIDKKFFGFLKKFALKYQWKVVVTCDHSTPCKMKAHSSHPVPVLIYDGKRKDNVKTFSESEARKGSLGKLYGKDFIKKTGLDR